MSNLELAKSIIKEYYKYARRGIYCARNLSRDIMTTLYRGNTLRIDICYDWEYFEVFGLIDEEFKELAKYYYSLKNSYEV